MNAKCFYQLRQLHRIGLRRSLDAPTVQPLSFMRLSLVESTVVMVCLQTHIGPGQKLQRDLNVNARVISNTRKFDRGLTRILGLHDDLHWLEVGLPRSVSFKLCVTINLQVPARPGAAVLNRLVQAPF